VSLGRYACRVLQQAHRQEIITGLKDATQARGLWLGMGGVAAAG
jgi:hypothetical protein